MAMGPGPVRAVRRSDFKSGKPPAFRPGRHETAHTAQATLIPMPKRIPRTRAEWTAWATGVEVKSPARFRFCVLALAAVLMTAHCAINELGYYPEKSLWKAGAFWSGAWIYAAAPFVIWSVWNLISIGRLKTLKPILVMATLLCTGSALAFCVPDMLRSVESLHLHRFDPSIEEWHWFTFRFYWRYWTPLVLTAGNLVLLQRWMGMTSFSRCADHKPSTGHRCDVLLKILAVTSATAA